MNILKTLTTTLLLTSLAAGLAGCATSGAAGSSVLPSGGTTMAQVYNNQMSYGAGSSSQLDNARSKVPAADYSSYKASYPQNSSNVETYSNANSANAPKMLPNPSIRIYVYPHFDGNDQDYVSAHTAYVKLYKQAHFALPGEAAE